MNRTSQLKRVPFKRKLASNGSNGASRASQKPCKGLKRGRIKAKADPKLVAWGKAVRERDGNQCQIARFSRKGAYAITGIFCAGAIDPHHIAPRGRRVDLKYVVDNGVCLCRRHHDAVHDNPIEAEWIGLLSSETRELARKREAIEA